MKGLIWNCRGLRKKGMSTYLKELINQHMFAFIGLQETMVVDCCDSILRHFDSAGDYLWKWNSSIGKSGVILVGIIHDMLDVDFLKQGDFILQMNLWDKNLKIKWNLMVVYGLAHEDRKREFLAELSFFCSGCKEHFFVGGNNEAQIGVHSNLFNSPIQFHELREIHMTGGKYSWTNNRQPPILAKLDRILMNSSWEKCFPYVVVNKLSREISDHNPLILDTGTTTNQKMSPNFKFELGWFKHPDFLPKVEAIWKKPCRAGSALDKIQQKLKLFKQYFKGWDVNRKGQLRKRRREIYDKLQHLESVEESQNLSLNQIE
ncbi:hypothetical protein BS78_09G194500 [Paspalum vaginatum]|nr:hypothetical protein BS78_09G194500 [Paspalum vaginatum]